MRLPFVFSVALLAACGGDSAGRTLNHALSNDPRSLDPARSTDVTTGEVTALLFDNLVQVDEDGRVQPGLALRWDVDPTGTVYTFHLRGGVRFHDGTPLSARQVRASLLRGLDPASTGGRSWPLEPIVGAREYLASRATDVAGIAIPDDSTVVLTIAEPLNIFLTFLAMPVAAIVPDPVPAGFDQAPVGTGPWRFVSWAHDDQLVLVANADWWGGPPRADTLRIRIIPEPLTRAAEYEAGNLSVVEVPFAETRRWEASRPAELQRRAALRAYYVAINTTRGPLVDLRVRQALNHAIDLPTILATVMGGRGVLAAGAVPPGLEGHDSSRARYVHDPVRARALLAEAGHATGMSLQLWRSPRAESARVAQAIQQDLAAVGVAVEIVERDAASARAAARSGEADLFLTDWWADYPSAENFLYPLFHSANRGPGGNLAFLNNPMLDQLLVRQRATTDPAEQAALALQADQMVFDLAPWIFGWFPVDLWAVRPGVTGWRLPAVFNGQRWTGVSPGQ